MTTPAPLPFVWSGDSFIPRSPHVQKLCDQFFTVGEVYKLEVREERSDASHSHYFASINSAFENLPEHLGTKFPTAEALRRFALIMTGFRTEKSIFCASDTEAARMAAFMKGLDDQAVLVVDGRMLSVLTAQSQSYRAMGKEAFAKSKTAVLEYVSSMIGTDVTALNKATAERQQ